MRKKDTTMQKKGGDARAKKLSKERRKEIASNAANVRWGKLDKAANV